MRPGHVIDGRFELESVAGRGGMGTVYRARDRATGETVAVKLLTELGGVHAARFAREAEVLAGLVHPAVVRHVAHGAVPEGAYLAMQWLEGEDLAARLARAGRLTARDA